MLPIIFDVKAGPIILVGEGELVERRLELLDNADALVEVFSLRPTEELVALAGERLSRQYPSIEEIQNASLLFGAGLAETDASELAARAREFGVLVNIEDVKKLCDFHIPSMVRRGDLTVTVSTGGKSPGLAKRLRRHLERIFGAEWEGRLDEIALLRDRWRADGLPFSEISKRTDGFIDQQGWLS
jgi:precorrin-2 dehydrogenase